MATILPPPPAVWDATLQAFTAGGRVLSGLCPVLQALFYPSYTYYQAALHSSVTIKTTASSRKRNRNRTMPIWVAKRMMANARLPPNTRIPPTIHSPRQTRHTHALKAGVQLDNDLTMTVELANRYHLDHTVFMEYGTTGCNMLRMDKELKRCIPEPAMYHKAVVILSKIGEPARAVWKALRQLNWYPVESQPICSDLDWGIATKADLVCRMQNGHLVVVENKLGYKHAYHGTGTKMLTPFQNHPDAPVIQWQLQLMCTFHMYRKTYPEKSVKGSIIFHVNEAEDEGGKYHVDALLSDVGVFSQFGFVDALLKHPARKASVKKKKNKQKTKGVSNKNKKKATNKRPRSKKKKTKSSVKTNKRVAKKPKIK